MARAARYGEGGRGGSLTFTARTGIGTASRKRLESPPTLAGTWQDSSGRSSTTSRSTRRSTKRWRLPHGSLAASTSTAVISKTLSGVTASWALWTGVSPAFRITWMPEYVTLCSTSRALKKRGRDTWSPSPTRLSPGCERAWACRKPGHLRRWTRVELPQLALAVQLRGHWCSPRK